MLTGKVRVPILDQLYVDCTRCAGKLAEVMMSPLVIIIGNLIFRLSSRLKQPDCPHRLFLMDIAYRHLFVLAITKMIDDLLGFVVNNSWKFLNPCAEKLSIICSSIGLLPSANIGFGFWSVRASNVCKPPAIISKCFRDKPLEHQKLRQYHNFHTFWKRVELY